MHLEDNHGTARLEEAEHLASDIRVEKVAHQLGFPDLNGLLVHRSGDLGTDDPAAQRFEEADEATGAATEAESDPTVPHRGRRTSGSKEMHGMEN